MDQNTRLRKKCKNLETGVRFPVGAYPNAEIGMRNDEGRMQNEKMFDPTLINTLKSMAKKEKSKKDFMRRARINGVIVKKSLTKNGNIRLEIKKGEIAHKFIIIKTHKERYALAQKLKLKAKVYAEGIRRFSVIICTRITLNKKEKLKKKTAKGIASQTNLNDYHS